MGFELTCNGGSFSGKNVVFRFSRSELNNPRSASVCGRISLSAIGFEVSCNGGSFSGENLSRKFRLSDCQRESSGNIRLSSSMGLEVNWSGGNFSGCMTERMLSASDCQTDLSSSAGGRKLRPSYLGVLASRTGGSVVCSAINSIQFL